MVDAKERGVDANVVLDQNIDFVEGVPNKDWSHRGKNQTTYQYLSEKGVNIAFDDVSTYTRVRALVGVLFFRINVNAIWKDLFNYKNDSTEQPILVMVSQ